MDKQQRLRASRIKVEGPNRYLVITDFPKLGITQLNDNINE